MIKNLKKKVEDGKATICGKCKHWYEIKNGHKCSGFKVGINTDYPITDNQY